MEEAGLTVGDVVAEALAALRVLHGGDDTGRLVEREELVRLRGDGEAVDLDLVLLRVDAAALLQNDLAVDLDPGLLDQLLAGAPGAVARAREDLLQPLALLLGAGEGLGQLDVLLARVALPVALLGPRLVLAGRGGRAAAALLGPLRAALGAAAGRGAAARLGAVLGGAGAHVVAPLLRARLLGTAALLVVAVVAGAAVVAAAPAAPAAAAAVATTAPAVVSAAVPAAAASHQNSVLSSASPASGASGSNDGTPSSVSASIASASGRKGASSGSSSRPRRPIRSRK